MNGTDPAIVISFGVYLLFMILIGWYFYRRTKNLSDYILGDRKLNAWVTSMSAQASDMSGWLLMGLPGLAYLSGMEALWIALGLGLGTWFNWKFVARRLRIYTEHAGNSITIPDYFENRFRNSNHIIRIISALFILFFFMIYTSSGFVAGAKLFSSVFNLEYSTALGIGAFVIISYTLLGGFMAVSWTDFFQGLIMFFAIIVVPGTAIFKSGGIFASFDKIKALNSELLSPFTTNSGDAISLIAIASLMGWGLGYFGQPHILARFMAITSPGEIKKAKNIAMIWVTISLSCAVITGIAGRLTVSLPLNQSDAETVFIVMVQQLIPSIIGGLLMAAVLAAIMSTADSQLLVTSSAITKDFYKVLLRKDASPKELVWIGRLSVALVAVIAWIIAGDPSSSVLSLVAYAWAGFGATFGPLILFSLYWERMTAAGAMAGIVAGGSTVILWKSMSGGIWDLYEIIPGFIVAASAIVLVSLITKPPSEEICKEFRHITTINETRR